MLLLCPLIAIKLLIFCIFEFLYLICNVKILKFKPCLREKQRHVAMMKAVTCWTGNGCSIISCGSSPEAMYHIWLLTCPSQ